MADKYLSNVGGLIREVEGKVTSAGAGDAGKIVALDSTGRLDQSVMPAGILPDAKTGLTAGENLAAGDLVYINASGEVVKADASIANAGRVAVGFVKSTYVAAANDVMVFFEGTISGLTGLTIGAQYFLSGATAGAATATAPTTSGHSVQSVGRAISATEISFEPQEPVVLA